MAGPLLKVMNTGVRILPQRAWEARERELYQRLYGSSIRVEADGTLVLPWLPRETLANLLDDPAVEEPVRRTAIELAVVALAALHDRGITHGDAMADNVMIDLEANEAYWFDFETVHDAGRPIAWRRADDVRALLTTSLLRSPPARLAETLELVVERYADEEVLRHLGATFASALQRPLPLHLGQAGLSFGSFTEIGRVLGERIRAYAGAA
jgi:serine/threonine protein kinase